MGLSNRERQARHRAKQRALIEANPELVERELVEAAEGCEQLSDPERIALADKLADMANRYLWRAHELAQLAMKVRVPG
jgi:hypothetical protein